jgi:hypothetical protein
MQLTDRHSAPSAARLIAAIDSCLVSRAHGPRLRVIDLPSGHHEQCLPALPQALGNITDFLWS